MILLANNSLPVIIGGVVVLGLIILAFYIRLKTVPSATDKVKAEEFLKGLADTFYKKIIEIMNNIKIEDFSNLEEFEANALETIYDALFEYTESKVKEAAEQDIISALVLKALDKELIMKFLKSIIEDGNIEDKIKGLWDKHVEENIEELNNLEDVAYGIDVDGNKIYYTGEDYNEGEIDRSALPPVSDANFAPTADEKIIPPSDDENTYFDEATVEEIDDENDVFIDGNGRKRSKKTGRYTK